MIPIDAKDESNAQVIELLKHALEFAEDGKLVSIAIVAAERSGMLIRAMAGLPGMETQMFFGLERLKDHVKQIITDREQRTPQTIQTADYRCWSLRDQPHSYDFLCALISAEMARVRGNAPAPLKICFYGSPAQSTPYASQFFNGVMVPALAMIGAVIDPQALKGASLAGHDLRNVVEGARRGEIVPKFKPSTHALAAAREQYEDVITLTLREAEHCPQRNSNIPEWKSLALCLQEQGERVVFIRDTAKASEPLDRFETHPLAATNLDARLALYESARCNFFASNGPFGLALFSARPWLAFQHFNEEDIYHPNRPSYWKEHYGMEAGEQFPWSAPYQRLIVGPDTVKVMYQAWHDLRPALPPKEDQSAPRKMKQ